MLKLERPLVWLDVETTGAHPQVDRVVQVGVVKCYPDGNETEWQTLINPGMPIPQEATACHGIVDNDVATAPTFKEVAPKLAGGLMGCDFGGYNIRFDLLFLRKEFERLGGQHVLNGAKVVDPFRIYVQRNPRNLSACYKDYTGEELEDAHDALADARAALVVFQHMLKRHDDLPRDVAELHKIYFETPAEGHLEATGKIAWRYGEASLNFGQHAGLLLRQVPKKYLRWMVEKGDFSDEVKRIVQEALRNQFPVRED